MSFSSFKRCKSAAFLITIGGFFFWGSLSFGSAIDAFCVFESFVRVLFLSVVRLRLCCEVSNKMSAHRCQVYQSYKSTDVNIST